jgi:phosphoribosylformylglycinamidine (FGAM) synthase-like enzyme
VRACQGCYDAALAYRTPFISGKDSLYNEFNGQPIPGTLLISAIGIVPDMHALCDFGAQSSRATVSICWARRASSWGDHSSTPCWGNRAASRRGCPPHR